MKKSAYTTPVAEVIEIEPLDTLLGASNLGSTEEDVDDSDKSNRRGFGNLWSQVDQTYGNEE